MKAKLSPRTVNASTPRNSYYKVWDTELSGFFLRVMPSGIKTYCIYYRHEGVAREYTIGKHGKYTAKQARDEAKIKIGELTKGKDIQTEKKILRARNLAKKNQTLGGFVTNKYEDWITTERKTAIGTLNRLENHFSHLYPREMASLKPWDIQKWRTEQLKGGLKPSTLNRQLMALKAVLSKAVEWEIIEHHPLASVKPLKVDKKGKIRYLTDEEEIQLRNTLDLREDQLREDRISANQWRKERDYKLLEDLSGNRFADYLKPMVLLAINTGMRRGELFDLTWENVDFKKRNLTIEGATAKSGSTRHIPLNDEALGLLIAWRNQTNHETLVFPNPNTGKRFDNIQTSWQNLLKAAKIRQFRFHDLRHHFASKLVMVGVDLNTVRELLGHSELTMTLRYAHLAPERKAAAVEKLNM